MRKAVLLTLAVFLWPAVLLFAQTPDPRDSIILESKTVYPGAHPGSGTDTAAFVYIRAWITNKDSLTFAGLALIEQSTSGGGYMTLARPRTFDGVINRLTNTLGATKAISLTRYNSSSPDSFRFSSGFDPLNPSTIEPPNPVRKPFWEIKFDTVFSNLGVIELDSGRVVGSSFFTNTVPVDLPVNFLKSTITVASKGDLNLDGEVRPSDVVLELQCVFLGDIPPAGFSACDLNCDGQVTAADVAVFLTYKFLTLVWPC